MEKCGGLTVGVDQFKEVVFTSFYSCAISTKWENCSAFPLTHIPLFKLSFFLNVPYGFSRAKNCLCESSVRKTFKESTKSSLQYWHNRDCIVPYIQFA